MKPFLPECSVPVPDGYEARVEFHHLGHFWSLALVPKAEGGREFVRKFTSTDQGEFDALMTSLAAEAAGEDAPPC